MVQYPFSDGASYRKNGHASGRSEKILVSQKRDILSGSTDTAVFSPVYWFFTRK
jgi:hypothetical protein